MDTEGVKKVLERNRELLVRNVVPCDELLSQLHTFSLLTDTMVREIKECPSQEQKNSKLLELLLLRGSKVLAKFCDCLQLTGHGYLADMLREEVEGNELANLDLYDILKKCPKVNKAMHNVGAEEADMFKHMINEKVREMTAKQIWQYQSRDKVKAMDAKQRQLEDTWKFSEVLKDKDNTIRTLQEEVAKAKKDVEKKSRSVDQLEKRLQQLKDSQSSALDAQMKFNSANDSTLKRVEDRARETEAGLQEMLRQMLRSLNDGELGRAPVFKYKDTSFTTFHKVRDVMEVMREKVEDVVWLQKKYYGMKDEREELVKVMGGEEKETDTLKVFKQYEDRCDIKLKEVEHKLEILQTTLDVTRKSLAAKDKALLLNSTKKNNLETKTSRNGMKHDNDITEPGAPVGVVKVMVNQSVQTMEIKLDAPPQDSDVSQVLLMKEVEKLRSQILSMESKEDKTKNENIAKRTENIVSSQREAELKSQIYKLEAELRAKATQVTKLRDVGNKLQKALNSRTQQVGALQEEMDRVTIKLGEEDSRMINRRKELIMKKKKNVEMDIQIEDLEEKQPLSHPKVQANFEISDRKLAGSSSDLSQSLPNLSSICDQISMYNQRGSKSVVQGFDLAEPVELPEPDIYAWRRVMSFYAPDDTSIPSKVSRRTVGVSFPPLSEPFPRLILRPKDRQVSIPAIRHKKGAQVPLDQTPVLGAPAAGQEQSTPRSKAVVTFSDTAVLRVKQDSTLTMTSGQDNRGGILRRT